MPLNYRDLLRCNYLLSLHPRAFSSEQLRGGPRTFFFFLRYVALHHAAICRRVKRRARPETPEGEAASIARPQNLRTIEATKAAALACNIWPNAAFCSQVSLQQRRRRCWRCSLSKCNQWVAFGFFFFVVVDTGGMKTQRIWGSCWSTVITPVGRVGREAVCANYWLAKHFSVRSDTGENYGAGGPEAAREAAWSAPAELEEMILIVRRK